jgi:hypothetical protein
MRKSLNLKTLDSLADSIISQEHASTQLHSVRNSDHLESRNRRVSIRDSTQFSLRVNDNLSLTQKKRQITEILGPATMKQLRESR